MPLPDFNDFNPWNFDSTTFFNKLSLLGLTTLTYAVWWQNHITETDDTAMTGIHILAATLADNTPLSQPGLESLSDAVWNALIHYTHAHFLTDIPTTIIQLHIPTGTMTEIGDVYTIDDFADAPTDATPLTLTYPNEDKTPDTITIALAYYAHPLAA